MNQFSEAFAWLLDPEHWSGPDGIPTRLAQHLGYTAISVLIAGVIGIGIGLYIGHTGRLRGLAVGVTGALRALPTLGLLMLFALWWGIGLEPAIAVLVILAIPPLLGAAYSGLQAIDRATIDAARSMGMNEWQILTKVELPLALPIIVGGLRSATLQVVATATVAAYLPLGGLGRYIFDNLPLRRYDAVLAGAILVTLLALVLEGILALAQRFATPRGVSAIRKGTSRRISGGDDGTTTSSPPSALQSTQTRNAET